MSDKLTLALATGAAALAPGAALAENPRIHLTAGPSASIILMPRQPFGSKPGVQTLGGWYYISFSAPIDLGMPGYKPRIMTNASGAALSRLSNAFMGLSAKTGSVEGLYNPTSSCIFNRATPNINWTPRSSMVAVEVMMKKADVDAVVQSLTQPISFSVTLDSTTTCRLPPASTPRSSSAADDDDDK